jgi:hypothetical protein
LAALEVLVLVGSTEALRVAPEVDPEVQEAAGAEPPMFGLVEPVSPIA